MDYLLKYVSNECFNDIVSNSNSFILEDLKNSFVDVDLNIRYLIKLGIKNVDSVVYDRLEELVLPHNDFIKKMNDYEDVLGREELINMLENL